VAQRCVGAAGFSASSEREPGWAAWEADVVDGPVGAERVALGRELADDVGQLEYGTAYAASPTPSRRPRRSSPSASSRSTPIATCRHRWPSTAPTLRSRQPRRAECGGDTALRRPARFRDGIPGDVSAAEVPGATNRRPLTGRTSYAGWCAGLANCEETVVPLLNSALVKAYEFDRRRQRLSAQALSSSAGTSSVRGGAQETRPHRSRTTDSAAVRRP
jgi:hypothetical protein